MNTTRKALPALQRDILAALSHNHFAGTASRMHFALANPNKNPDLINPDLIGISYDEGTSKVSDALRSLFKKGLLTRLEWNPTHGDSDRSRYFYALPPVEVHSAADAKRKQIELQMAAADKLNATASPSTNADLIASLRHEIDGLRKQCERHQITEASQAHEIADANKKIHQLARMTPPTRGDCNRGYNVFAVQDRQFIDEIYSLDEAVSEAKRLAEAQGVDYVVVETAARATFSKTVTVEVIGK